MRRREFIAGFGSAAAWPVMVRAQQGDRVRHIGVLMPNDENEGLKAAGYVEGQNVAIEYRWAENQYDRLPTLAADLVGGHVAVIAAGGVEAALAAKAAAMTIPIIYASAGDPVASGLIAA
jgi:putative ABC transport system substrate-binding protein